MSKPVSVLCFGEIVWDALPEGIFLGGAPLNVAYHLNKLGCTAYPVSRIGQDFLGEEILRRLERAGVPADLVQVDPAHRSGAVVVSIDGAGDAKYEILEPAAWDFIQPADTLMRAAREASALVYGTLSTRGTGNPAVLHELIDTIPFSVCDVNLRKPYDDPANAIKWASRASVVKLNDEELGQLAPAGGSADLEEQAAGLVRLLGVKTLVVTRGAKGAFVLHAGKVHSIPAPRIDVMDTIGAGDAFTAAFINGFIKSGSAETALKQAIRLGGFVAGQRGAQPEYDADNIL